MKCTKILSHHTSLASAVEAANLDLSYNEQSAKRTIKDIDAHCDQAFVTDDGVFYIYKADIKLLHHFDPFISCLSGDPFRLAFVIGDTLAISQKGDIPKTPAGRKFFRDNKFGALAH